MRRCLVFVLTLFVLCGCGGTTARALNDAERTTFINQLIGVATEELGSEEETGGYTKYADWGGENKYGEWCSEFTSWCVDQTDQRLGTNYLDVLYPRQTACIMGVRWFSERGRYVTVAGKVRGYGAQWHRKDGASLTERPYVPKRGDFIFFEWYKYNRIDHMGIVEYVEMNADGSYTLHTIEGNHSTKVARFTYALDDPSIRAFGVTNDEIGTEMGEGSTGPIVQQFQQLLIDHGHSGITADGQYGQDTVDAVRMYQEAHGFERSGIADRATQEALGFTGDSAVKSE